MYRWTDGWQMTFCIMPGNHMGSTVTAGAIRTNIEDEEIPYIESREDYERLAMVCSWYDANGSISADNATYAAAQTAVWAIVGDGWDSGDSLARIVDEHVKGTYNRWITLKEYVEGTEAGSSGLPEWCSLSAVSGKPQQLVLKDGQWSVELDISANPGLASLNWVFEGDSNGWSKSVGNGKMAFSYNGSSRQEMVVSAVLPETMKGLAKNTTSLNLYIPNGDPEKIQAMISAGPYEGKVYVKLIFDTGGSGGTEGEDIMKPEVEIYRHTETFSSHYNLELEKYCAETGKTLEGALFRILEAFNDSQINGKLDMNCMTPMPVSWDGFKVCSEALTNENGYVSHTDIKEYEYSKTYCDGHPEPEYLELPEPSGSQEGGIDNSEEIAAVEEANEAARAQWEALVQACAAETDFHSEEPGEGLKMMLADREETYQQFINLEYDYTVEEIQARYGYIRHGLHEKDKEIPIVRIISSEAGAESQIVGSREGGAEKGSSDMAEKTVNSRELRQTAVATPLEAEDDEWNENKGFPGEGLTGTDWVEASPSTADRLPIEEYLYWPERPAISFFSDEEWDAEGAGAFLPEPQEDDVEWIESAGPPDQIGYSYQIYNHRTEGEVHINKKDLELPKGETQGDAALEGAVYGLYAAEDIIHPDGKTGVVFGKNQLTATATTDDAGNASFTVYTVEPQSLHEETWIGHSLILGQYYIKEIARSEGYELSVQGRNQEITNLHTRDVPITVSGRADVVTPMTHPIDMHDGSWLEFDVTVQDTTAGFDILVSGFPEDSAFYRSGMDEVEGLERVVTGTKLTPTGDYELAHAGEYKLDSDGNYIPLLDLEGNSVWDMDSPVSRTYYALRRLRYYPSGAASPQIDLEKWEDMEQADADYVLEEANCMLEQLGYTMLNQEHGDGAPWTIVSLSGSTNQELIVGILNWFSENSFWDSGAVHKIWQEDGQYKAAVFHDYRRLSAQCIYDEDAGIVYVKQSIDVEDMGKRHIYVAYPDSEVDISGSYVTIQQVKNVTGNVHFLEDLEMKLKPVYAPLYQQYEAGEYRLDGAGNPIPVYQTEFVYEEKPEKNSEYSLVPLSSSYDKESGTHRVHVENMIDWNQVMEPVTMTFRAVANGKETVEAGKEEFFSDFLTNVQGVGASAFAAAEVQEGSYIKMVPLTYPGQISVIQDGTGIPGRGSKITPITVEQRMIKQKVKVIKDIRRMNHGNEEPSKMDNFRFKAYLKSNLERLYRNESGDITWIDKNGVVQDINRYLSETQALVPVIRTLHDKDGLYKRILETIELPLDNGGEQQVIEAYNYEKFFHAMRVANHDKWDDAAPSYTSYRPVGNQWNKTEYTMRNILASDQVRQFAIDWYLDAEVEQLTEMISSEEMKQGHEERQYWEGGMDYGDELYDEALFHALEKARDYLKPFFQYDLDDIYSIDWDLAENGGSDQDKATVSADEWAQEHYYGLSEYLPYGTYIVAEQQPQDPELKDYPNKHYRIDAPKEVVVPSVYADYQAFLQSPPGLSSYYRYHTAMSVDEMEERYFIRLDTDKVQDGAYASALVPWSMVEPQDEEKDLEPLPTGESTYHGYAGVWFRDIWYQAMLRIEKLDSETHENLLHDEAVFSIYVAERDISEDGEGAVKFYEEDTMISGSREFLESIGAGQINPMLRGQWKLEERGEMDGPGNLYTGIVPAGTPVFREEDKVSMLDREGAEIGEFTVFTTMRDGLMQDTEQELKYFKGKQNVGYLQTPEPLDAGAYVLVEHKAPAGYVRMKPIAVEIYSDEITYYQQGSSDKRVVAAIYDWNTEDREMMKGHMEDQAVIFAENAPTQVWVKKVKEASVMEANTTEDKTVTWIFSGRIDGPLAQIGNNPEYEYAYLHGDYQGYAWRKGTLEYLHALKAAGKQVELVYDGQLFAGYGYITEALETADDVNPYVVGAQMTLFEAAELTPSGNQDDYTYEGLHIERNLNQEVTRMYLDDGRDILYYDLSHLDVFDYEWVAGQRRAYGYDKAYHKVSIEQLEQDRRNYQKTDKEHSIFAFKEGIPYLELAGGDFTALSYSELNHCFDGALAELVRDRNGNYRFSEGMVVYHLDEEGNRDSLVDPKTGMAYVLEEIIGNAGDAAERILVWPVKVSRDPYGNVVARDKITTFRIATVGENEEAAISQECQETGYITGTWTSETGNNSHELATTVKNQQDQNMNGELLLVENAGHLEKQVNPVVNEHGQVIYYQAAEDASQYHVETLLYDRDGDMVRRKTADLLEAYDLAGYAVQETPIYHRQGEGYILENTWITGDTTPNDPFQFSLTAGQADVLKRVPSGTYIMEEVKAPKGYLKGFPQGVTVEECSEAQTVQMVDYTAKIMIGKVDGTEDHTYQILDMLSKDAAGEYEILGHVTEGKSGHGYRPLAGAQLTLSNPDGTWNRTWVTDEGCQYLEEIPIGTYMLEEACTPEGFVTSDKIPIQVENTREVQNFMIYNDHTKVEFEKYMLDNGQRILVNGAGFTLYKAKTDADGQILYKEGKPQYDEGQPAVSWKSCDGAEYRGFITAFEEMYRDYGIRGEIVSWESDDFHHTAIQIRTECIDASVEGGHETVFPTTGSLLYRMEDGREIRVVVYQQQDNRWGKDFVFEYQFDYRTLPMVNSHAVSYVTADGIRRLDYLPVEGAYVLVETEVPEGFAKAEDVAVYVRNIVDVQRYSILNQESMLMISKTAGEGHGELAGAQLALFRAGEYGELVQDDAHLAAQWISGADGRYTELDKINRRIPEGYQEGDLKPHILKRLPDGVYYLVELQAPDYYTIMKPKKIIYNQEDEVQLIRISDEVVKGELLIRKTDSKGQALSGAIFQVTAYLQEQPVFVREYSEHGGELLISDLPVGEVREDGSVNPYRYEVKELFPPEGYAAALENYTCSFMPGSYGSQEPAREEVTVVNEQTRFRLTKGILQAVMVEERPAFAEGAGLAVYHVTGRGEQGQYLYDEEAPVAEWITSELEPVKEIVGLIGGQTYLLLEKDVPAGLRRMGPVAFTISSDGREIEQIYSDISLVSVQNTEEGIKSITVRGRYGVGVEVSVKNHAGEKIAYWMADGNGHELRMTDDIREGETCTITETAVYSDGSRETIGRTTRIVHFTNGVMRISDRKMDKVVLELVDDNGDMVDRLNLSSKEPLPDKLEWVVEEPDFDYGRCYRLMETSVYSDGSRITSGMIGFVLNENAEIQMLTVFDKAYHVLIHKQDFSGTGGIPGATLQLKSEDGTVLEEWISGDEPHEIMADLVPGNTYTLHEERAPKGFGYASDITFVLSEDGVWDYVVMVDKMTHVRVRKTDITGEEEVPGATLQILDEEKNVIEEWISQEEPHDIVGILEAGKEYWLHEEHAPEGYAYAEDIRFVVSKNGEIELVSMKDRKKPVHPWDHEDDEKPQPEVPESPTIPEKPNQPEEEKLQEIPAEEDGTLQIGRILAVYKRSLSSRGKDCFGGFVNVEVPRLGDEILTRGMAAALGLSILGLVLSISLRVIWKPGEDGPRSKRGNTRKIMRNSLRCLLIGGFLVLMAPLRVQAAEGNVEARGQELTITFDAFTEACQSPVQPPEEYQYQGQVYYLKSSQLVSAVTKEKEKYVEETVVYEAVEQADELPREITMEVTDLDTGVMMEAEIPILNAVFDNWRWIPGFEFVITVQQYDLGQFYLGDTIVTEGELFDGYETELLELIGVNPGYYLIESIGWMTDAWTGEDGLVYRQARAAGQKYVADCKAVYKGSVILPETEAMAWQAVYSLKSGEPGQANETEAALETANGWRELWQRYSREITVISVGLVFLLLMVLGIFVYKTAKSVYD